MGSQIYHYGRTVSIPAATGMAKAPRRRAEDREAHRRDTWAAPASPCPVVDQELDILPALPVVGAQFAGEMEAAAACVEQRVAERLA